MKTRLALAVTAALLAANGAFHASITHGLVLQHRQRASYLFDGLDTKIFAYLLYQNILISE